MASLHQQLVDQDDIRSLLGPSLFVNEAHLIVDMKFEQPVAEEKKPDLW